MPGSDKADENKEKNIKKTNLSDALRKNLQRRKIAAKQKKQNNESINEN